MNQSPGDTPNHVITIKNSNSGMSHPAVSQIVMQKVLQGITLKPPKSITQGLLLTVLTMVKTMKKQHTREKNATMKSN